MKVNKNEKIFISDKLNKEMDKLNDKSSKLSNIFQILLLIFIISISSYSIISYKDYVEKKSLEKEADTYEIATQDTTTNEVEILPGNDEENSKEEEKQNVNANTISNLFNLSTQDESVIGTLQIPSANISGMIKNGIDYDTLDRYIGKYENSVQPGAQGNLSLFAHNNTNTQIFRNLDNVQIGNEIIIKTRTQTYTYVVNKKYVISPYDVNVLDNSDQYEITLITCTPDGNSRIVVKGILK